MPNTLRLLRDNSPFEMSRIVFCSIALDIYGVISVLSPGGYCLTALVCPTHSGHYRTTVLFEMSRIVGFCHVACSVCVLDIRWLLRKPLLNVSDLFVPVDFKIINCPWLIG